MKKLLGIYKNPELENSFKDLVRRFGTDDLESLKDKAIKTETDAVMHYIQTGEEVPDWIRNASGVIIRYEALLHAIKIATDI